MKSLPFLCATALLAAAPTALAHEGHGLPGVWHGLSDQHVAGSFAVAIAVVLAFSLRRPLARVAARWRSRR